MMNAQEIIAYIGAAEKKTPVKVYVNERAPIDYGAAKVFGQGASKTVFGDWRELGPLLAENAGNIQDMEIECDRRNSAIPLLELKHLNARIEPGAIIREQVEIGDNAVIMMGAVINIGAVVGPGTMIDMGAILGGRATVGSNCHIGAGAVLRGSDRKSGGGQGVYRLRGLYRGGRPVPGRLRSGGGAHRGGHRQDSGRGEADRRLHRRTGDHHRGGVEARRAARGENRFSGSFFPVRLSNGEKCGKITVPF